MTAACPTLYILMRTDMASMNPGKAMAQAAHASNQFVYWAREDTADLTNWEGEGQAFGTTIVLAVNSEKEMHEIVNAARDDGFRAGVVHDHTYPLKDGSVIHYLPVDTCAYVYTPCRNTMRPSALAGLSLHP